jgi:hypothetical protein
MRSGLIATALKITNDTERACCHSDLKGSDLLNKITQTMNPLLSYAKRKRLLVTKNEWSPEGSNVHIVTYRKADTHKTGKTTDAPMLHDAHKIKLTREINCVDIIYPSFFLSK